MSICDSARIASRIRPLGLVVICFGTLPLVSQTVAAPLADQAKPAQKAAPAAPPKADKPAQKVAPKADSPANPASAPKTNPASPSNGSTTPVTTNPSPVVEGDYVPCKFTVQELRSLVTPEASPTLTEADENTLKMQVYSAAQDQTKGALANGAVYQEFMRLMSNETLAGLTPSQALNRVVLDLTNAKNATLVPAPNGNVSYIKDRLPSPSNAMEASDFKSYLEALGKVKNISSLPLDQLQDAATTALDTWMSTKPPPAASSIQDVQATIENGLAPDNWTIVNSARKTLATLERPTDVGCAMSILTYRETDTAFGFRIAREYIAVQIVVRNLSRDQPFALHDAEFQVNLDPEGRYGRFFSGRDKVVVRALSTAQSSFDPRALIVHGSQLIGAIASATVPIFSVPSLTNGTSVFNGAFTPGLDKFWKDESADQLNLLNDTGFSSQLSSQTTVSELGTVVFVIFIPAKQFEEGWWTMPCVDKVFVGHQNSAGLVTVPSGSLDNSSSPITQVNVARALESCAFDGVQPKRIVRHWWELGLGRHYSDDNQIDKVPVAETPQNDRISVLGNQETPKSNTDSTTNDSSKACKPDDKSGCGYDLFRNGYPRPYRSWSGNSIQIFATLSSAIVSGAHTTEDSQTQPSLTALNCPTDSVGNLKFPAPDKGTIQCPMTGKNLDKVSLLRLRDAKDATDVTTAEGQVTVSGDSTSGNVEFQTSALHALPQPAYAVFAVSSRGVETKTSQTVHLSSDPVVSTASDIDFTKDNAAIETLTISGYHLDQVDTVVLTDHANAQHSVQIPLTLDALKSSTQLNVLLDPSKNSLSVLGSAKITADITFKASGKSIGASPAASISFTGPSTPKPAQKPKAAPNAANAKPQSANKAQPAPNAAKAKPAPKPAKAMAAQ